MTASLNWLRRTYLVLGAVVLFAWPFTLPEYVFDAWLGPFFALVMLGMALSGLPRRFRVLRREREGLGKPLAEYGGLEVYEHFLVLHGRREDLSIVDAVAFQRDGIAVSLNFVPVGTEHRAILEVSFTNGTYPLEFKSRPSRTKVPSEASKDSADAIEHLYRVLLAKTSAVDRSPRAPR